MKIHKDVPQDKEVLLLIVLLVIAGVLGLTYLLSVIELYLLYIIIFAVRTGRITFLGRFVFFSGTRRDDPFIFWMTVGLWIFVALIVGWTLMDEINGIDIMRHSY